MTTGNDGYAALAGYDLATGLGTPRADRLLPALAYYGVPVPEPSTWALLGVCTLTLVAIWRKLKAA